MQVSVGAGKKSAAFPHSVEVWAMVPRWARAQCSIVRLARGRESLGGQRMADILILPPSGCGTLVLDGTKCL